MKILGIEALLPSRVMDNEAVVDLIRHHSHDYFSGDLEKTLQIIGRLLHKSGMHRRRWLAPGEKPMEFLHQAFASALKQANLRLSDIDLLIYTGVARGFVEPANSCFVAQSLGLRCRNFDVLDACMGWVSSMDIVNAKMRAGESQYAAVVNMEFNLVPGGHIFPKNFVLHHQDELAYKFPSYTIGEALTVTILGNDSPDNFSFHFSHRPDLSDLCTISLPAWEYFCEPSLNIEPTGGAYQFSSFGKELHDTAMKEAVDLFRHNCIETSDIKHVFTHTSSPRGWKHYAELMDIHQQLYPIAQDTGNIVTASIPTGLVWAQKENLLHKEDMCLAWKGSAGMSFSSMKFLF